MKLKITEHNGALMVSVQGTRQELVIYEESGGFELELRELERVWWEEPSAFESASAQKEVHLVTLPVVEKESQLVISPVVEPESDLFAKLANLRRELAYANGLPPYIIFHDKSLWEMVETMPQDLESFGKISGVGQAKLEKYGEMFLSVINGAAA